MSFRRRFSDFARENRGRILFVIAVILALLVWNIYVRLNDGGIIMGQVEDPQGRPVPGATVSMWESSVNLSKEPVIRQTDAQGRFVYEEMELVEFVVSARKQGYGKSERKRYHLYFKKQNFELPEPLILTGE